MKLEDLSEEKAENLLLNFSKNKFDDFSLLMSVYKNDEFTAFKRAFVSVLENTVLPTEVVIIFDGPVNQQIEYWLEKIRQQTGQWIRIVRFKINHGLGKALQTGVIKTRNSIIARADADDINVNNRFELELNFLKKHPSVGVVGGQVKEFNQKIGDGALRIVPTDDVAIRKRLPFRNPFNHPTVMFRKELILNVGNYQSHVGLEDYDLWFRLLHKPEIKSANLKQVLVHMNVGNDLYARRGGNGYVTEYTNLKWRMFMRHYISLGAFIVSVIGLAGTVVTPPKVKKTIYSLLLRK